MYNPLIIIIPILSLYYPYIIPILSLYHPYIPHIYIYIYHYPYKWRRYSLSLIYSLFPILVYDFRWCLGGI